MNELVAYFLGIITGLTVSALVFSILVFFRTAIEKTLQRTEIEINKIAPRAKGGVFFPKDLEDERREEIIKKNRALGKPTRREDFEK